MGRAAVRNPDGREALVKERGSTLRCHVAGTPDGARPRTPPARGESSLVNLSLEVFGFVSAP